MKEEKDENQAIQPHSAVFGSSLLIGFSSSFEGNGGDGG